MLVDFEQNISLYENLSIAATAVLSESQFNSHPNSWVKLPFSNCKNAIGILDKGAEVVLFDFKDLENISIPEIAGALEGIPSSRLALKFTPDVNRPQFGPNFTALGNIFSNFVIINPPSLETVVTLKLNVTNCTFIVQMDNDEKMAVQKGFDLILNSSQLTLEKFVDLYLANAHSDRDDGLISTVVVDEYGVALGLCYSSKESVLKGLETKSGVYMSRKRGLWHKGASSGATQELKKISFDCDFDTLRFTVSQNGPGFCHLNTRTCFGNDGGISGLYNTLQNRKLFSPTGSYTKRLFEDKELLASKIKEEAEELCEAIEKNDIAWEAADLLYFALVKCVSEGVSLADIERQLDARSRKISRRPGNAKPKFMNQEHQKPILLNEMEKVAPFSMRVYDSNSSPETLSNLLLRPIINTAEIMDRVKPIVNTVRSGGDKAVKEFTKKFDGVELESVVLKAPFDIELMQIRPEVKAAIDLAYDNVEKFHAAQLEKETLVVETIEGVKCSRFWRPIEKVGLYVPGGTAVLPSSTLMLGIPAKVAGCSEIIIATPPRKDGSIVPEVVYVAHKVGASMIVKAGGAQAVAAMAYGTESVPKVDKICGPGNQYVTAAKMVAQSDSSALLSIDMPAGPSELLVIADHTAEPKYVISDLLSQAEHGVDSQVVLLAVGLTDQDIERYQNELYKQATVLPRSKIVEVSLSKSYILRFDTIEKAMEFSNKYAPEHLILNVSNAESLVKSVQNAGSVFVGPWSPESCGDYASGTNHTLPTYGYARMYSGVNTHTFVKHITSQTITKDGLNAIGDAVTTLAEIEGLEAHRNAVAIRLRDIREY